MVPRADAQSNEYNPPHDLGPVVDDFAGALGFRSDQAIHDRSIYREAWRAEKG